MPKSLALELHVEAVQRRLAESSGSCWLGAVDSEADGKLAYNDIGTFDCLQGLVEHPLPDAN
jgi:hypothetical protein